jgi:hypothetical protein
MGEKLMPTDPIVDEVGELGRDPQDFRQSLRRKGGTEGVIDVFERHTAGQAFED